MVRQVHQLRGAKCILKDKATLRKMEQKLIFIRYCKSVSHRQFNYNNKFVNSRGADLKAQSISCSVIGLVPRAWSLSLSPYSEATERIHIYQKWNL